MNESTRVRKLPVALEDPSALEANDALNRLVRLLRRVTPGDQDTLRRINLNKRIVANALNRLAGLERQ